MPPRAYMMACVISNPSTLLQKEAAIKEITSSMEPTKAPGRLICGQRCIMTATTGVEKYMTPICVVPMAAMLDPPCANSGLLL